MQSGWKNYLPAILMLAAGSGLTAQGLSLSEALRQSVEAHPDATMARARVEQLESMERQSRSGLYPHLAARVTYMQTTNPMQGFGAILSQGTFDGTLDFNDPGQLDALTAQLEARYRLYSGGARESGIKAAGRLREAGGYQLKAAESALEKAVVGAYFGIRQADAVVRSVEAGIRVHEENLRVSRIKEESGDLIRTERLNLEVELAALNRELLSHRNQARMARIRMAFLLGLPASTPIELLTEDPTIGQIQYPGTLGIERRPELQAARAAMEAAAEQVRVARSGRLPTMDAFASWQADRGWRREGDGTSWTAGIVLNMPLFDGQQARSRTAAARAAERIAEEQVRRLQLSLQMELEEARLAHELARAQREVAEGQVVQAEEAAKLSRERFSAGTLLSTELIGVESRLIDARVQLALATSQEWTALAHLRHATGERILIGD